VEGQTETQEVRNQEDEPEVRDHTESREPNKEGICVCSALTRTNRTPDWIVGNDLKVGERSSMIIVAYF
jgi:hypothetical protein